jgi:hypothetical protein
MKTNTAAKNEKQPVNAMDFFPDPRTIPGGWDMSTILTPSQPKDRSFTTTQSKEASRTDPCQNR